MENSQTVSTTLAFKVACVIPSFNGADILSRLLRSLTVQSLRPDVLVVDSSSSDGTAEVAKSFTDKVTVIPSSEFNHGGTRQRMVNAHPNYEDRKSTRLNSSHQI